MEKREEDNMCNIDKIVITVELPQLLSRVQRIQHSIFALSSRSHLMCAHKICFNQSDYLCVTGQD